MNAPAVTPYDIVVQIGAFQPWLDVDQQALAAALEHSQHVLLLLSDADRPASANYPFRVRERLQILQLALPENWRARVHIVGVRQNHAPGREWAEILRYVQSLTNKTDPRIGLLQAPDSPPRHWPNAVVLPYPIADHAAADWRAQALGPVETAHVPARCLELLTPATRNWFAQWLASPQRDVLHQEWQQLAKEHQAWSVAPYPPTLVTVDCVVECAQHVLLIERGRPPGKGLWALPGGFIDIHETLLQSAVRELHEETGLKLPASLLPGATALFDAPYRSQRGRVITQAFHFVLPDPTPPAVQAGDDAAQARWVRREQLAEQAEHFHDDHALILDHFLQIMPPHLVMELDQ